MLKRSSDAVADSDRILGVIRGIKVNPNGRAMHRLRPLFISASWRIRTLTSSTRECNRQRSLASDGSSLEANVDVSTSGLIPENVTDNEVLPPTNHPWKPT
ncbi:hypothetical protein H2248_005598 [Termitomyces sp. 'cryptogamus']|nr:hypothetical protein H2248_007032 [Termitomyces sp. 'cryptogamus']KAH0578034.1 hypothetical protein H2248_005573 [Termitomyces sp. 'cryptogamus']KAH0578042.1 hypothetical protein H2248_005581 [Termitomyces sp. 'cryptogamus']KAH0578048.1 hypothetical protein H2248_005587 [Termitomyces sp. 'cryptogamus']KAH0578059.1 hypothetical protein H2248_005598 [Termitomyces sp. 'cryptogamus']